MIAPSPHVRSAEAAGARLLAFGRELAAAGDAQVGGSFTDIAAADELIKSSANAFLFGVLFTQGIPAERAWAGPWLLRERLGHLHPARLRAEREAVECAFAAPPCLHRFKRTLPGWVVSAAARLIDEYDGDAANVWRAGSSVLEVTERLSGFDGIGRKKAAMAVEILTRHFGVQLAGAENGRVAYDIHVRRVFLRSGLASEDTPESVEGAAADICPGSPGTLDLPAWLIGRQWCRPKAPDCEACPLGEACFRLKGIVVEGVGVRR